MWVWLSIAPGRTKQPVASSTSASTPSKLPTPAIVSPSMSTSARTVSTAVTIVPPRMIFFDMRRLPEGADFAPMIPAAVGRSRSRRPLGAPGRHESVRENVLCSRAVDAVFFGALAGALFGLFTVAVRYGLSRGVPVELGAAVTSTTGFLVVTLIALVSGSFADPIHGRDVLAFAAIGAVVPGLSQIAFNQAVGIAGAAR